MNKQHVYEEEEFEEQAGPNWTLIIVGYFALLAVIVVLLRPLHMSMGGIFFAMVIAGGLGFSSSSWERRCWQRWPRRT
jgi:hypothetical protein